MKKVLVGLLLIVAAVGLGRVYFMKAALASRYSLNDLQKIAAEANKSLPIMVDQATRLDAVVASEHRLEKQFTLVATTASSTLREDLTSKLYPMLKSQSCQSSVSMNLYQSGVTEAFTYFDMNGDQIASFTVDKSACDQG
jgi:hypothetical protein